MQLKEAVEALKKKGFAAQVVSTKRSEPYILGGVRETNDGGIRGYDDGFTVTNGSEADIWIARTAYPGQIGEAQECYGLDAAVDWLYHVYLARKAIKPVPSGKSWAEDAQTLLDMGASAISADTVRGLLADFERYRGALGRIETKLLGRVGMNGRTATEHHDFGVKHDAGVRAKAYINALNDVRSIFQDLEKGE